MFSFWFTNYFIFNSPHFWKDNKGANINSIRTKKSIEGSDVVIVKFGEKYKQWNAAFDAGYASALNKSIIVIHSDTKLLIHISYCVAPNLAWIQPDSSGCQQDFLFFENVRVNISKFLNLFYFMQQKIKIKSDLSDKIIVH